MFYKIDTKEKFHVIIPEIEILSEKMADMLIAILHEKATIAPKNVIVNCSYLTDITPEAIEKMANLRSDFYENDISFVMCCFAKTIFEKLQKEGLDEVLNITPTESEAWDIVQMDEIEREFLNDAE